MLIKYLSFFSFWAIDPCTEPTVINWLAVARLTMQPLQYTLAYNLRAPFSASKNLKNFTVRLSVRSVWWRQHTASGSNASMADVCVICNIYVTIMLLRWSIILAEASVSLNLQPLHIHVNTHDLCFLSQHEASQPAPKLSRINWRLIESRWLL